MVGDEPIVPPIDSQVLVHASAFGSVGTGRLPKLLTRAQAHLADELEAYRRGFECVHEDDDRVAFVVPEDHWEGLQDEVPLGRRAADAVRRAHEQQLRRIGSETGRREEFETALEIRSAVIVGLDGDGAGDDDAEAGGDADEVMGSDDDAEADAAAADLEVDGDGDVDESGSDAEDG